MAKRARPPDWSGFGFLRVAAAAPPIALGDPDANARTLAAWARRAADAGAGVVLFPELALTGYTCEDLLLSEALLDGARRGLRALADATRALPAVCVAGAPYRTPDGRVYNVAFVLHRGRIRGAIPKTHLPNGGEFYEPRWFASGAGVDTEIRDADLGTFRLASRQGFSLGPAILAVEICEDLWAPAPVSTGLALGGANVILNLSASNDWVGKADIRRALVRDQSARLHAGYVYASAGPTESTKDLVFGGHTLVAEDGTVLAEGPRFALQGTLTLADLDIGRLLHDRSRSPTFTGSAAPGGPLPVVPLGPLPPLARLSRAVARTPFVPDDPATVDARAREILTIQATGLARRLQAAGDARPVLGLSGGLDSTLACLVAVDACRLLGRKPAEVLAVAMPGFGTTAGSRGAAKALAARLGVTLREIPIGAAVTQHFRDIGQDPRVHDVTYENAQARERTQILFDLANREGGLVVGTGDLSELALGWCTYNADHMAGYAVNASVPKTLVRHLVSWWAAHVADGPTRAILAKIVATPISPELLPPKRGRAQSTEAAIGPFELHDFFLFHHLRHGAAPAKVRALARHAFAGAYTAAEIDRWLRVFLDRFYRQQYKRTTLPPGPKVGSVSLSPRGDLRMPDEIDPGAIR